MKILIKSILFSKKQKKKKPGDSGFARDVNRLSLPIYLGWFNGKSDINIDKYKQKNPPRAI